MALNDNLRLAYGPVHSGAALPAESHGSPGSFVRLARVAQVVVGVTVLHTQQFGGGWQGRYMYVKKIS